MNKISTLIVTALAATLITAAPASATRHVPDDSGSSQPWDIAQHVTYRHELLSLQRAGQA